MNYIFHLKHFDTSINFLKVRAYYFSMFLIYLLLKRLNYIKTDRRNLLSIPSSSSLNLCVSPSYIIMCR